MYRRRESAEVRARAGPHHAAVLAVPRHQLQGRAAAAAGRTLERHLDIDLETRAWNEGYPKVREDFTITEKAPIISVNLRLKL